ncbi:MAG: hypothetical protein WBV28_09950 [Terracidiphilus sp.]
MPEILEPAPQTTQDPISAVTRCSDAFLHAYREVKTAGKENRNEGAYEFERRAKEAGLEAYRKAMPPLAGTDNIRGFIACIAYGMLFDVFSGQESTRLLYAAQVANTAASRTASPRPAAA